MTKRRVLLIAVLFALLSVFFAISAFAVTADEVKAKPVAIKVKQLNRVVDIQTTIGQLFKINVAGDNVIATDLNSSVESYNITAVVEIHIPTAIKEVNISGTYNNVTSLIIDDYGGVKITNIKGFSGLQSIKVGFGQTTFGPSSAPASVKSLVFSGVDKNTTTYTISDNAFNGATELKTITFDPRNTYIIGKNAFKGAAITELNLPDGAKFTLSGEGAFANCESLETIYGGDGLTALPKNTFENCVSLKSALFMSVSEVGDAAFAVASAGADKERFTVYMHTDRPTTFGANTFSGRKNRGVLVCAISPNITSFNNCTYELLFGVQHLHEPMVIEPTCTEEGYNTYKTDCPCGKTKNAVYKRYKSGEKDYELIEMFTTPIPKIPHSFKDVHSIEYKNGMNQMGAIEYSCEMCNTREGVDRSVKPLFDFPGYSVSESGANSIVLGIRFNSQVVKLYENMLDGAFDFGIVLVGKSLLNGENPLKANGDAYSDKVYKYDMSAVRHYDSTLKLTGLSSAMLDTELVLSAYIKMGDKILYADAGGISDKVTAVTYNQFKSN